MGYEPGTITIWDVESGELTSTFKSEQFNWCLAWSPDSRRLAVGTLAGYSLVWDVPSGERILSISEQGEVRATAWSPDGSQFATGLSSGVITLRETESGKALRQFRQSGPITTLAYSPDSKQLGSGNNSGVVRIWDVTQDQGVTNIADNALSPPGGIAFSPDDRNLAYWTAGQIINIGDLETGQVIHRFPGPAGDTLNPAWSPNGKHLACGGNDGSIVVYDLKEEDVRSWQHEGVKAPASSDTLCMVAIAWHPDGRQLASVSHKESTVRIWDAPTGKLLYSYESSHGTRPDSPIVGNVAWSPDGKRLATGGGASDGSRSMIEIRDRVGWRKLHSIDVQVASSTSPSWSGDGRYLAVGGFGLFSILDTFTGRPIRTISGHSSTVDISGWSKDGQRLATCAIDGVRLFNPQTGQEIFSLPNAKKMAWSHDRKRIATIEDGKVRIYDASIGYRLANDPSYRSQKAEALLDEANTLIQSGNYQQALEKFETALCFAPEDGPLQSKFAFHMLTFPEKKFRDLDKATAAARRGTELSPDSGWNWAVLGITQYRQGQWAAARTSLLKQFELDPHGVHPRTSCFLAMTCWKLGEKETARRHYDDAVGWIEKNQNEDSITLGFRDEAAELLGIDVASSNMKKRADKVTE